MQASGGGDNVGERQLALVRGHERNPFVKVAVWTMTVSMGVMTFLVLNTSKYWM